MVPFSLTNVTTVINTSRRGITIEEGSQLRTQSRLHCTNYCASRSGRFKWLSRIDLDSLRYLELHRSGVIFESNRSYLEVTSLRRQH